jgi:tetratricopeptide (TPR) repeat protein
MTKAPSAGPEPRNLLDQLLRRLALSPGDAEAAYQLAELGLDHGFESEAVDSISRSAEHVAIEPRLWQMLGLLYRALQLSDLAIGAFQKVLRLAPEDLRAAHGLALSTLEAGLPAVERYDQARRIAPDDPTILLGHVSALAAENEGGEALDLLAGALGTNPRWVDGHLEYARLSARLARTSATETIDAALAEHPGEIALHLARSAVLSRTAHPETRLAAAEQSLKNAGDHPALQIERAVAASEAGRISDADAAFLAIGGNSDPNFGLALLRHLVRAQRFDQADVVAGRLADGPDPVTAWAYRHTAWRAMSDPRLQWLEQDGHLVRTMELGELLPLAGLGALLHSIHTALAQPLDQSVRGGTQTDGPLFARIEPEIRQARRAIALAVGQYIASLPPVDRRHPLLSAPRDPVPRFVGSWSVSLGASGHHANHIHGQGWLSSALYVELPKAVERDQTGWLTLGAPPAELGLNINPSGMIRPSVGRLVLFPSYMWHGVTPFHQGERLTIAFDVGRPRNNAVVFA